MDVVAGHRDTCVSFIGLLLGPYKGVVADVGTALSLAAIDKPMALAYQRKPTDRAPGLARDKKTHTANEPLSPTCLTELTVSRSCLWTYQTS